MTDELIEEAQRLVRHSSVSVPEHAAMIDRLAARIASLEAELDTVTASLELTLPDTQWLIAEVKKLRAERDGLAAIIGETRHWRDMEYHDMHASGVGEFCAGCENTSRLDDILAQSSIDALAQVKAEAAATALEEQRRRFHEYTLNYASPEALFDHMMKILSREAAAIRSEVK